jgi:hypothetical protein
MFIFIKLKNIPYCKCFKLVKLIVLFIYLRLILFNIIRKHIYTYKKINYKKK